MEPVRLAKSFSYAETFEAKGAIFKGAVFADDKGLYLVHNSHSWESAGTAMAVFGLLGVAVHHFMTRNKPIEYPFPSLPVAEVGAEMRNYLDIGSFKDSAEVSIITKDQIRGFSKTMLAGTRILVGDAVIVLLGASGKAVKQLPEMGYVEI